MGSLFNRKAMFTKSLLHPRMEDGDGRNLRLSTHRLIEEKPLRSFKSAPSCSIYRVNLTMTKCIAVRTNDRFLSRGRVLLEGGKRNASGASRANGQSSCSKERVAPLLPLNNAACIKEGMRKRREISPACSLHSSIGMCGCLNSGRCARAFLPGCD